MSQWHSDIQFYPGYAGKGGFRLRKPSGVELEPAWGDPILEGVNSIWMMDAHGNAITDLVSGARDSIAGGPVQAWDETGPSLDFSSDVVPTSKSLAGTAAYTKLAVYRRDAATNQGNLVTNNDSGGHFFWTNNSDQLQMGQGGSFNMIVGDTIPLNETQAGACNYRLAGTYASLWQDGKRTAETTSAVTFTDLGPIDIGGYGAGFRWPGKIYFVVVWDRCLSPTEMQQITTHPYSLLRPIVPQQMFRSTAGANITVAATETGDAISATIDVINQLVAAITETGDVALTTIQVIRALTAAVNEGGDTVLATLGVNVNLSVALSESGDTQAAAMDSFRQVVSALSEDGDTAVVSLEALIQIVAATSETGDTVFASLVEVIQESDKKKIIIASQV